MESSEITTPKFLHEIHGKKTTLFDIILTYSGGIIALATIYTIYAQSEISIPIWKLVLLLIMSADIGAGVVANFTKGTNSFYSGDEKKQSRLLFILTHFLHPAAFFFALNLFSPVTITLVFFVIASTLIINAIKNHEKQKVIAALLTVLGISGLFIINISNPFLLWFFPMYMIKLFLAFGIRRHTTS